MAAAEILLKSTRKAAGKALSVALATGGLGGLITIAIAWLLSGIIAAVAFAGADLNAMLPRIGWLALLFVIRAIFAFIADQAAFRAAANVRRAMFAELIARTGALGPVRLADLPTGEAVTLFTDAVASMEPYWRQWIPAMVTTALIPGAIFVAVLPLDGWSALIFAVSIPLMGVFLWFAGMGAQAANQRQWATLARLGGHLLDAVQGLTDLKIFRAAQAEVRIVRRMAEAYRRDTMAVLRVAFLSALVLEFFSTVAIAAVAVMIGFRLLWGEIDFHIGFFILLLAPEFYAPLRSIGVQRHARMESVAAAEKLADFFARKTPKLTAKRRRVPPCNAVSLIFDNVHLSYDKKAALNGLDFGLAPGGHVALVGPSGAGKSTVFSLLLGFVAADKGRVLIDGMPLGECDIDAWRAMIAYVPQKPYLFDADIDENIAMGRVPPGETRDAMVTAALKAARADAFVDRLPQGRRTVLGENGAGISGGEVQRLALARAFFMPAPLVLFDEPTAHLDPVTEAEIGEAIAVLTEGRTRITIAHRLASMHQADEILVLEDGLLAERGTHASLLAAGGAYARLLQAAPIPAGGAR